MEMTIFEALDKAKQDGVVYYRPINGDIVDGSVKMKNCVKYKVDVNLDTIKDKYFEFSEHFMFGAYLFIDIENNMLGICYDEEQ